MRTKDDPRLVPLLTPAEVARLVDMPQPTVYSWMRRSANRDAVMHVPGAYRRGWPSISLVGLAEAHTARGLRKMHVSMQKISLFAEYLRKVTGDEYALATPTLVTDGIDVFFEGDDELVRLLDGQRAAKQVVEPYLSELVPWADDLTGAYRPPALRSDLVEIDPRFNSGRMSFRRNRVPLFAVMGSLAAGEPLAEVTAGYGLTADEVALVDIHKEWLSQAA